MQAETLATGYFNDPLTAALPVALAERYPQLRSLEPGPGRRWLWDRYCAAGSDERAAMIRLALGVDAITIVDIGRLESVFPHGVHIDAHLLPATSVRQPCESVTAPALMITGWYDWCLDDALRTWESLAAHGRETVRARSRLLITPTAHDQPGYHEGKDAHPGLNRIYRDDPALLVHWYDVVRGGLVDEIAAVTYYLMGANEWRAAPSRRSSAARPIPRTCRSPCSIPAQGDQPGNDDQDAAKRIPGGQPPERGVRPSGDGKGSVLSVRGSWS
jgi:uncharacterized protein